MEKLLNKEAVVRVKELINRFDSNLKILVLQKSAKTAKDASELLKCEIGAIVKSLLFKVDDFFLICLIAGDKRCSLSKLKTILKSKNIRMASPEDVKKITGFSIGGVAPVGHIKKMKILIDISLARFSNVFAAAGHPNCIFKIEFKKLLQLTDAIKSEITE